MSGLRVGSRALRFEPGTVRPGEYFFDIGTAGATALYLPLMWAGAPSTAAVAGGYPCAVQSLLSLSGHAVAAVPRAPRAAALADHGTGRFP
ncbi:MAG: RNA 3'-terminal phosphate cyclase [Gammaproteobacteria bacterium]